MSGVREQFAGVLTRIAAATNVKRTVTEDGVRFEVNGGSDADLTAKVEAALPDLEKVARRLEASI